jgi:hypothetical protein
MVFEPPSDRGLLSVFVESDEERKTKENGEQQPLWKPHFNL